MNGNKLNQVRQYITENNSDIRRDKRIELIKRYNLLDVDNAKLSELFDVSPRTIQRDKREVRKRLSQELEQDFSVAGELFAQYKRTIKEIDDAIGSENYSQVKAIEKRWRVSKDFAAFTLPFQLENLSSAIEKAREKTVEIG